MANILSGSDFLDLYKVIEAFKNNFDPKFTQNDLYKLCKFQNLQPVFYYKGFAVDAYEPSHYEVTKLDGYFTINSLNKFIISKDEVLTVEEAKLIYAADEKTKKLAPADDEDIYRYIFCGTKHKIHPFEDITKKLSVIDEEDESWLSNESQEQLYPFKKVRTTQLSSSESFDIVKLDILFLKESVENYINNNRRIELNVEEKKKPQGDPEIILGAVLDIIRTNSNLTQDSIIQKIEDSYPNVGGVSESTIKKVFARANKSFKEKCKE